MNDWQLVLLFSGVISFILIIDEQMHRARLSKRLRREQELIMDGLTTDPTNEDLGYGINEEEVEQNKTYLVLSEEERAKGFVRPLRITYQHLLCGTTTTMAAQIAETYAANPKFYKATYCVHCRKHRPVEEFVWISDGSVVGS